MGRRIDGMEKDQSHIVQDAETETPFEAAIRRAGGVNAVSKLTKVAPSTVCFRRDKGAFPIGDALQIELVTGIPAEDLAPSPHWDAWKAKRGLKRAKVAADR